MWFFVVVVAGFLVFGLFGVYGWSGSDLGIMVDMILFGVIVLLSGDEVCYYCDCD